nr:hypothetical protein Iba_chr11bCG12590 [Ipomoea batatas]GME04968.1 hypothetical protein Iba_scaffold2429CG0010 [Ipomoea batatas]
MVVEEKSGQGKEDIHNLPLMSLLNFWPQNSLHDYTEKMELHPPHANLLSVYHMWSLPDSWLRKLLDHCISMHACPGLFLCVFSLHSDRRT